MTIAIMIASQSLQLAAEVGAHAVSHLEEVSVGGIEAMAQAGVVAVLLPTTAYILKLQPPPARRMIEKGIIHSRLWNAGLSYYDCSTFMIALYYLR